MVCCIGNVFFAADGDEQGGRLWGAGVHPDGRDCISIEGILTVAADGVGYA